MPHQPSDPKNARHENVALLVSRFGSPNKFALAVGLSYALVRRLRDGESISDTHATDIERTLDLPRGWLDTPHPEGIPNTSKVEELAGMAEDNSEATQNIRRQNVDLLIGEEFGAKAKFAKAMKWHATEITHLQTRTFGHRKARAMEVHLGLPRGWLDSPQEKANVPAEAQDVIAGKTEQLPLLGTSSAGAPGGLALPAAGGPIARALLQTLIEQLNAGAVSEKLAHELLGKLLDTGD